MATACLRRGPHATREIPDGGRRDCRPDAREGQAGPSGKSDRPIVPAKPLTPVEGRGLSSSTDATSGESQEIGVSLPTPPSVRKLQTALQGKAKGSSNYRFYSLYDKLYRFDVLHHAYRCCQANDGAPGVDGQTFAD